jgi:hypothetical protein
MFKELIAEQLETKRFNCSVARWVATLDEEDKNALLELKIELSKNNRYVNVASLFASLLSKTTVPFKLTAFRSHMQGYCTCQN